MRFSNLPLASNRLLFTLESPLSPLQTWQSRTQSSIQNTRQKTASSLTILQVYLGHYLKPLNEPRTPAEITSGLQDDGLRQQKREAAFHPTYPPLCMATVSLVPVESYFVYLGGPTPFE